MNIIVKNAELEKHNVKNFNTNIHEGLGYIWDYAKIPDISVKQRKGLEKAWSATPQRYTQGIKKLEIEKGSHGTYTGGMYRKNTRHLTVVIKSHKDSSGPNVLCHEIHHHVWFHMRTSKEKDDWIKGVLEIVMETGMSPTRYSDSFMPRSTFEFVRYSNKMNKGVISIDMCYPKYDIMKNRLRWNIEEFANTKRFRKIRRYVYIDRINNALKIMKQRYDSLSKEEKLQLVKNNHAEMKYTLRGHYLLRGLFFDESHSETGSYIYAEKSMKDCESAYHHAHEQEYDSRINNNVIDRYVALYKRMFTFD